MTTEEAIKNIVAYAYYAESVPMQVGKAFDVAIAALRAQQEREKPKPLTLNELLEMDGEPVWVVLDENATEPIPGFEPISFWTLVEVCEESIFLTNNLGGRTEYATNEDFEADGITVYRHKPKEG